ncbi:MAG TPA: hypothetical protein VHZ55_34855, partial [Bryobacteraceae bacterium]|nr:hypothetical protein [Bryobacteraceae bacterium]
RRRPRLVMLMGLIMIGSFLSGCGSSSSSTQNPPAGSYAVTIQATGAGITQSSKVMLNIQ